MSNVNELNFVKKILSNYRDNNIDKFLISDIYDEEIEVPPEMIDKKNGDYWTFLDNNTNQDELLKIENKYNTINEQIKKIAQKERHHYLFGVYCFYLKTNIRKDDVLWVIVYTIQRFFTIP